jgi:hypothetical protein
LMATVLRNFTGKNTDRFRVSELEGLYRRRGGIRGGPGGPHHPLAWLGGGCTTPWCGCSLAPLRLSFGLHLASEKNRRFGLHFV